MQFNPNLPSQFDRSSWPGDPQQVKQVPTHLPPGVVEIHGAQPQLPPEFFQPYSAVPQEVPASSSAVHPELLHHLPQWLPARAHQLQSCRTNEDLANLIETLSKDETHILAEAATMLRHQGSPATHQLATLLLFSSEWQTDTWNILWPLLPPHWPAEIKHLEASCMSGWLLVNPDCGSLLNRIAGFVLDRYDWMGDSLDRGHIHQGVPANPQPWSTPGQVQRTTDETVHQAKVDSPTSSEETLGPVEKALIEAVLSSRARGCYLSELQASLEGFEGAEAFDKLVTFVLKTKPSMGCAVFEQIARAHADTNKPLAELAVAMALLSRKNLEDIKRLTRLIPRAWPGRLGEFFAKECAECKTYWIGAAPTKKMSDAVSLIAMDADSDSSQISGMLEGRYRRDAQAQHQASNPASRQRSLMSNFMLPLRPSTDDVAQRSKRQRVLDTQPVAVPQHGALAAQPSALLAELRLDAQLQKFFPSATSVEDMVGRCRTMRPGDQTEGPWSNFARAIAAHALKLHNSGKTEAAHELATLFLLTMVDPGPNGPPLIKILSGKPWPASLAPYKSECLTLMNTRGSHAPTMKDFAGAVSRLYG